MTARPQTPSGARSEARSISLFARAQQLMPGGVSSPVRAFKHVGGTPVFLKRGEGAVVEDEDGNRYVDFCLAWGPLILGHAHPAVVEAVIAAARDGLAFGTCHRREVTLAELVLEAFTPGRPRALRGVGHRGGAHGGAPGARRTPGGRLLLKFSGCYHGHVDATHGQGRQWRGHLGPGRQRGRHRAASPHDTLVVPLGDSRRLCARSSPGTARSWPAAILEPLPANNGLPRAARAPGSSACAS
jgi:glutamate-1-semialdehyde 2,1-aminomutase